MIKAIQSFMRRLLGAIRDFPLDGPNWLTGEPLLHPEAVVVYVYGESNFVYRAKGVIRDLLRKHAPLYANVPVMAIEAVIDNYSVIVEVHGFVSDLWREGQLLAALLLFTNGIRVVPISAVLWRTVEEKIEAVTPESVLATE